MVFPEIDYTRVDRSKGMNITLTTTAKNDEQGRELLKGWEFRFAKRGCTINGTHSKGSPSRSETEIQVRVRNRCRCCGRARGTSASFRCAESVFAYGVLKGEIPRREASW